MAISFPASLDTFTGRNSGDTISEDHMNDAQDAIEALEIKVGVDSSAVVTTLDYLVKNASSSNPGHKHTLANGATDVNATATEVNRACDLSLNNFFGTGRAVYFWENTAPTGWTLDATCADCVLAVKGGAQDYNINGGQKAASSWTVLGLGDHAVHNHQWHDFIDTTNVFLIQFQTENKGETWQSDGVSKVSEDPRAADFYTKNNDSAQSHTFDGTWRPPGGVGIIATKDA